MKRLLLPLIAALALPTAANAESHWLIIKVATNKGNSLEKVEMESISQCQEQGAVLKKSISYTSFACITGK